MKTELRYVVLTVDKIIRAVMFRHEYQMDGKNEKKKLKINKCLLVEKYFASLTWV